jgi:CDP-diacylglycerol---glycerol-3-phosphate 3-phosphatidyltransferase
MLDRRLRHGVERGLGPLGRGLRRMGVSADALTVFGLLASVVAAFLIGSGHFGWAVVAIIVAGVSDLLDGAIARGSGQASPRGAFFDSVTDRVSDALLLGGCAWYLVGTSHPYNAVLALAVAACSMLVSYERARAEALGIDARGGLMERAERFVILAIALAFNILVPVLWIMLVLTAGTAVYRFVMVYRQAGRPPAVHARREQRLLRRQETLADPRRPAPLRTWWTTRRMEGDRTRRRHPSVRRNSRP